MISQHSAWKADILPIELHPHMVKNLGVLPDFRHHCRRAHIYTDIHDYLYILIYFLVIATSRNYISFTLILMEASSRIGLELLGYKARVLPLN